MTAAEDRSHAVDRVRSKGTADIVIVIAHLGAGGAQRVATILANAWSRRGHAVTVLVFDALAQERDGLDRAVERIDLFDRAPRWTFMHLAGAYRLARRLPQLRRLIKRSGAPIVLSFIRPTNVKVILACLGLQGVRVVISERNDPSRQNLGKIWDLLSRLLYRRADVVTANSRGALESLRAFVPAEKLAFVPNPLLPPVSSHRAGLEAPTLLAVGRLVPQKGYDVLLSAFAKIGSRLPGWRLAILGDGPLRHDLERLARELGIAERIDWQGQVDDPFPYYRAARIFVLSSRFEGMPNALLEAMHNGLAAIVTDSSPGPLEVIEHERTGLVVPTDDDAALASAIFRLASDPGLQRRLGDAAREAMSEYSLERALDVWNKIAELETAPTESQRAHGQLDDTANY